MMDTMSILAENAGAFAIPAVIAELKPLAIDMLHSLQHGICMRGLSGNNCSLFGSETWSRGYGSDDPRFIMHDGSPLADVMFIGEAPGAGEWNTFIPLVGAEQVLISTCAKCTKMKECFRTILNGDGNGKTEGNCPTG